MSPAEFRGPARLDRDVEVGPVRLHFSDWPGQRGPIVCLPGMLASGRSFDGVASALAPEWRAIAVDLRGRGQSGRPARGYGYQVDVADVIGLVERLGLEQPVLVGHSWGAVIALMVAAWHPDLVAGLVLIDGGDSIPASTHQAVQAIVERLDTVYPSLEAYLAPLRRAPVLQPWTDELEAAFASQVTDLPDGVRPQTARWAAEQEIRAYHAGPPDYAALQQAVRCPTLVLRAERGFVGEDDHVLAPDAFEAMLGRMPTARGAVVDGTSHYTIVFGRPLGTIEALRNFVSSL